MGYEVTRFEADVEDFQCPICRDVLEEPMQIKYCEHMFCAVCIKLWTDRNLTCPMEQTAIKLSHIIKTSRFFQNQYNRLRIKCKFNENGCREVLQIETVKNHEMNCLYDKKTSGLEHGIRNEMIANVTEGQKKLIEALKKRGTLRSSRVEHIMLAVDRTVFGVTHPYEDKAKSIGFGSSISAPHMHATILQLLESKLSANAKVLDIGSGSGYLTICMALMVGKNGKVIGVDHNRQLIGQSKLRCTKFNLEPPQIEFITGNGIVGLEFEGPYDVINIGCAIHEVPEIIMNQLKPNGRIVVPLFHSLGEKRQKLYTIDKTRRGVIIKKGHGSVRFQTMSESQY